MIYKANCLLLKFVSAALKFEGFKLCVCTCARMCVGVKFSRKPQIVLLINNETALCGINTSIATIFYSTLQGLSSLANTSSVIYSTSECCS